MKVIKPQQLSVLTRCYEFRREFRLGISALAFVPMSATERRLIPELAMWPEVAGQMAGNPVLDAGIPKTKAEYLVVGNVFAPGGKATRQCSVMAEVGGQRKVLSVTGDREWRSPVTASEAAPFTTLPLSWSRAFGGPLYSRNPSGRGFQPESGPTPESRLLPNIEYPNTVVKAATERPEPAGFGALDVAWPQRTMLAGTHDERWLKEDFPGFARDIDWEFFNIAPKDQRFAQSFAHDAPYVLHHLHPQHAHLKGRLPSIRARSFVQRARRDVVGFSDLEEVSLALTTLWFFPTIERVVLIFQGRVVVQEDDASDLTHLMTVVEDVATERPLEHYRTVIARRCDLSKGHLYALKDSELCPAELIARDPAAAAMQESATSEDLAGKRLQRRLNRELEGARARVAALGLDPDVYGPPVPGVEAPAPDLEELPEYLEKLEAEAKLEQEKAHTKQAEYDVELERLLTELGLDFAAIKAEREQSPLGPPSFTVAGKVAELQQLMASFEAQGLPTAHVQEIIDDPKMRKVWEHGELKGREAYRLTAHLQSPAAVNEPAKNAGVRARVQERMTSGAGFAGLDLTGADLSGMKLDGANFEGAFLERVNLCGASLRGANLQSAVLAHADATDCNFTQADLRGCNLGSSDCTSADFSGARLDGAILAQAVLNGGQMRDAHLENTDLTGASLREVCFAGAVIKQVTITETSLRGVDFERAQLLGCNLLKVDLDAVRFQRSDLTGSLFLGCTGKADFSDARMHNVRMVVGCVLDGSRFERTDLTDANLRGASLAGAELRGATLERADLSGARLPLADMRVIKARGVSLSRAELGGARLAGANLMHANLSGARLEGADFSNSNVSGADLSRIRVDSKTRYESVLAIKTRMYPQHSPIDLRSRPGRGPGA